MTSARGASSARGRSRHTGAGGRAGVLFLAAYLALMPRTAPALEPDAPLLRLLDVAKIADKGQGFTEPSGLALASGDAGYWSVSDDTAGIFLLSPTGRLKPSQTIPVRAKGLEGVVEDFGGRRLLVVKEETAGIIAISLTDGAVTVHPLRKMAGFADLSQLFGAIGSNDGLEGITLDTATGEVVVVKESQPRLLIRLSPDLSEILGAVELTAERGFSCAGTDDSTLDVSDLTHDPNRRVFWILSDTGACVFLFDPVAGKATALPIPGSAENPEKRPKNPEGIALNPAGTELRIVTDDDRESRLYTLSID